jgi:hypothetical protein
MCGAASILSLAAVAYDRYTAIAKSLRYVEIVTVRKIVVFTVTAWIYAALVGFSPLFTTPRLPHDYIRPSCDYRLIHDHALILLLAGVFLPAYLVIFYCYSQIWCVARRHARAIAAVEYSVHRSYQLQFFAKDTKYAKTLAIVIGFFVVLWLPYQVCLLLEVLRHEKVEDWIRNYLALLSYLNSGINPWVYAYRNSDFRTAYKKIGESLVQLSPCPSEEDSDDRRGSTLTEGSNMSSAEIRRSRAASFTASQRERLSPSDLIKVAYDGGSKDTGRASDIRSPSGSVKCLTAPSALLHGKPFTQRLARLRDLDTPARSRAPQHSAIAEEDPDSAHGTEESDTRTHNKMASNNNNTNTETIPVIAWLEKTKHK